MELGGLAAERRDGHRVLEQAARVGVMGLGGRRVSHPFADRLVAEKPQHQGAEPGVVDLTGEELEEAVERLGVAARPGHELERIAAVDLLHVTHRDLELPGVGLDAAEHPDGVALGEPAPRMFTSFQTTPATRRCGRRAPCSRNGSPLRVRR